MTVRALCWLIRCELLKLWRAPAFSVPTLLFPALFYLMFGLPQADRTIGNVSVGDYILVAYSTFAVMSVGLFAFGVSIAAERASGWARLLRLTPLSPAAHLAARLVVAAGFVAAALVLLFSVAAIGTRRADVFELLLHLLPLLLPGVVPFAALGFALGHLCTPGAATAVANLLFLPLAFASGLFVPLEYLPSVVQSLAPWLPSHHLGLLGWSLVDPLPAASLARSLGMLVVFTAGCMAFAWWAWRRDAAGEEA
ncbi:MAG: ABC transporter permease [Pseudomonadota bacterium]|jgi:ABC-2 type transport system permease protein|nr:MAG: ABC transporter permease [Pseudomonadota bacterium]